MPTVLLSNFAGSGAQFFDDNGNVLSGGKIYTYVAGTSTAATTYTDYTGGTAHTNPIILNSAGRVSTGEIWVLNNNSYKFIVKTSADVTIATYDNIISGIGTNSVTTNMIVDGAITTTKIADASVTPAKLSAGHPTWTTGGNLSTTGNMSVTGTFTSTGNIFGNLDSTVTGTTQTAGDNSTKIATTAYVDRLATAVQLQPISVGSVSAGAFTVTLAPTYLMFRSPTSGSGTTYTRQVASSISITIPSGATFGYPVSTSSRIAIIAIDNAGTVLLGAVNTNVDLTETNLITTVAISGASQDGYTYYATTGGLSNLAYRVVGFIDATYSGSGVWTTVDKIQGAGGNSVVSLVSDSKFVNVASTSGASIDFTNIPLTARKITLSFYNVSRTDSNNLLVQIGYGSPETTGYNSVSGAINITAATVGGAGVNTSGFVMVYGGATDDWNGHMVLTSVGNNQWASSHAGQYASVSASGSCCGGGRKTVTTGVTVVRVTRAAGAGTFDAGTIGISYE